MMTYPHMISSKGGLSPPPLIASTSTDPSQLASAFSDGAQWGIQLGTAVLGFMLIACVLSLIARKS